MEKKNTFRKFAEFLKNNRFNVISWGVTALVVAALTGFGFWWIQIGSAAPAPIPEPTDAPTASQSSIALPTSTANSSVPSFSIGRQLELKTNITDQANTSITQYQVMMGDSLFAIAKQYNIKPETILYSNKASSRRQS